MDLYHHTTPQFTQWVVKERLLSGPLTIIDIGVQGGEHPRWEFLGAYARVHGFDAISEVVDGLKIAAADKKGRFYHNLALGDEDGERRFFLSANRFGSSFYSADEQAEERDVPIRRLDTLFQQGVIPPADYIKLDCEGFEPEILKGAKEYLKTSSVICVTVETNFFVSPIFPKTHFQAVNDILVDCRLRVYDWNLVRTPTVAYTAALARHPWLEPSILSDSPRLDVGRPTTYDVVFCRDFVNESRHPESYPSRASLEPPSVDTIIKAMINFELHGLMDCAVELAEVFRPALSVRFDVDKAIELLAAPPPHSRNTADVTQCLEMIGKLRFHIAECDCKFRTRIAEIESQLRQKNEEILRLRSVEASPVAPNDGGSPLARLLKLVPPGVRHSLRGLIGETATKRILSRLRF